MYGTEYCAPGENTSLDLTLQEVSAGHDDIVAGLAGEELGLQNLVGVVGVVDDLDPRFLRKGIDRFGIHVVRPIVDVDDALLCGRRRRNGHGAADDGKGQRPGQSTD
jgi:hypothetical protein